MRPVAVFIFTCAATAASAQEQPLVELPPPAMAESDEPAVRIPVPTENRVEEVRVGGRVVMLKVTPPGGKPYYLVDPGVNPGTLDDGVRFPLWPVYVFD